MDDKSTVQLEPVVAAQPSIYEQMYNYLYDYRFGRIPFLELLNKWREILDLSHPQQENS
jgi:hypothetical protein